MYRIFLATLFTCTLMAAHAQQLSQTIRGRILDEQSLTPLVGATVAIRGTSPLMGASTDTEGYFTIPNVPIGRHTLQITSIGYESRVIPELLLGSGKEVVLEIKLTESLTQMEEVVITASETEKGRAINELATISARSLTVEETGRYAATFDDPARAVLTFAGVSTGGDDLLNEIVIRGNSPKGLLWRLEGVEMPNPNHFANIGSSAGGISMLSNNVLGASDFYTGAFPAQYGNASSGIFDLSLRKGNFEKREHAFQAGLLGVAAASEGPVKKGGRASYVLNYRYSTLALIDKVGIPILGDQEDVTFQDLSFKLHMPAGKAGVFSLWGLAGHNTYGYQPDESTGDWWHEENVHAMGVAGLNHTFFISHDTYVESTLSASSYSIDNLIDSLYLRPEEDERFQEGALRLSSYINHKFNARHSLRAGLIASGLSYDLFSQEYIPSQEQLITYIDEKGNTSMLQGYANWQVRPSEALTINSGLHFTRFGLNNSQYIEPRMGFRLKTGKGTFSGGAGLHSRMESLALYMAEKEETNGNILQLNKDLSFLRAAHVVLGYELPLATDWRLKTEVYYQYLYDVPVWGQDTTTNPFLQSFSSLNSFDGFTPEQLSNEGTGRNYGIEFTLEKYFTNQYYLMATASLYESRYKGIDGVERDSRFNGNFIYNVIGGKEIKVGRAGNNLLSLNGRAIWAGGKREAPLLLPESRELGYSVYDFRRNFDQRLSNYLRFDIGISYRKNKERSASIWALNIQNVLGRSNEYGRYYNSFTDAVESGSQVGIFPNISYRVEF